MVACDGQETEDIEEPHPDDGKTSAEIQEEIMAEQDDIPSEITTEVLDVKYYNWLDESVDEETITVYAEIENTSNISIHVDSVDVTYLDSDGSVIAVNEAYVSPGYLKEGSIGYLATEIEDDIERFKDLDEVDIEVMAMPFTDGEVVELDVIDNKLNVDTWGEKSAKVSVTGFLKNESDISFDEEETNAMIGLYDKDNNFLAAELMYSDQEFSVDAGKETSFEFGGGSPLPPAVREKTDHAEVNAIGIQNEEEY